MTPLHDRDLEDLERRVLYYSAAATPMDEEDMKMVRHVIRAYRTLRPQSLNDIAPRPASR